MGKSQCHKKKSKKQRHNPAGIIVSGQQTQAEADAERTAAAEATVLPVVKKLSSPDPTERAWACAGVSNLLLADETTRRLLLESGLVSSLVERLTDDVREVALEAAGALRNLTVVGGQAVCIDMYEKDVLTPLLSHINRISIVIDKILTKTEVEGKEDGDERGSVCELAEQVIAVIWSLIETSDRVLKAVNNTALVPFLVAFLNPSASEVLPSKVVVMAAQCLNTLSDDNEECHKVFLQNPGYVTTIRDLLTAPMGPEEQGEKMLIRVLGTAILTNLRPSLEESMQRDLYALVFPILGRCLELDVASCVVETSSLLPTINAILVKVQEKSVEMGAANAPTNHENSKEQVRLSTILSNLTTLQLCLELLANICSEDTANDDADWTDAGLNEEEEIEYDTADAAMVTGDEPAAPSILDALDGSTGGAFTSTILPGLLKHAGACHALPEAVLATVPDKAQEFMAHLSVIHVRSCSALNNIFLNACKEWFAKWSVDDSMICWNGLFSAAEAFGQVPQLTNGQRVEALESLVGCLWSLARGVDASKRIVPATPAQITTLIQACSDPNVASSMHVKCLGLLGVIGRRQGHIEENKTIGTFLISLLPSTLPGQDEIVRTAELVYELLNAVYDMYGDENFDYDRPVFISCGFLQRLKSASPIVRNMAKNVDRRMHRDLRSQMDETYANLVAFVKYKEQHM